MEILNKELLVHHFSHEHPLSRTNSSPSKSLTCSGCNLIIPSDKDYYDCKTCQFSLHQVCYHMPRKAQHPAHPNHQLTLLNTTSLAKCNVNCKACGDQVTGFYYFCSEYNISYHILCSTLPLSVTILSHPHTLKLDFSPPCDLFCDVCTESGFNGWLYRCALCEFDTHLSCAIANHKSQCLQHPSLDCCCQGNELMQIAAKGIVETKPEDMVLIPSNPRKEEQHLDQSTPVSADVTIPSYQFSDAYFSIDLQKSYSSYNEAIHDVTKGVPQTKDRENRKKNALVIEAYESRSKSGLVNQITKSDSNRAKPRYTFWWKFVFCS